MVETFAILSSAAAGFAGLPWQIATFAGGAVFFLTEAALRDAFTSRRMSSWQTGPWTKLLGAAFIGAGECCLGWAAGLAVRLLGGFAV